MEALEPQEHQLQSKPGRHEGNAKVMFSVFGFTKATSKCCSVFPVLRRLQKSDEGVLRLVGKLVSRATTLLFYTFRDSNCNTMRNAEQAERRTSQAMPDGRGSVPDGKTTLRAVFDVSTMPDGTTFVPDGMGSGLVLGEQVLTGFLSLFFPFSIGITYGWNIMLFPSFISI